MFPPLNAAESAAPCPSLAAACAVLTFALVADIIPKNPARQERPAPHAYASAVAKPSPNHTRKNIITAKIPIILYSLLRNTIAPS